MSYNTYNYKVADAIFSITISPSIWEPICSSYKPFFTEEKSNPCFLLHVLEDINIPDNEKWSFLGHLGDESSILDTSKDANGNYLISIGVTSNSDNISHLYISNNYREAYLYLNNNNEFKHSIDNSLMIMYALSTAPLGIMLFHSSVVLNNNRGYMFLGKSGTGKSTHSKLWGKYIPGTELLNDDNPAVRINNGTAIVYGTPWSGKTPCYKNKQAQVGGIIRLQQAPYNKIEKLGIINAYGAILPSISCMKWEKTLADQLHENISKLISTVPVFCLECLPDKKAAQTSFNALNSINKTE